MKTPVRVTAGGQVFEGHLEDANAPETVAAIRKRLPYDSQLVHVRWSGEGVWIPLGDEDFGVGYENHTSHPGIGHFLLYPGGISETEIVLAYGGVAFSSKMGQLAGNHFLTLTTNLDQLPELGRKVLWHGAQDIRIEEI